jgi:Ca-activated chloride channel homolog
MQLLAPWALVFLVLLPLIIVFYLLKQKKEQRVLSSTMLWQRVLADTISQTPWQRLRYNLLLLLQLLLVLLLVLALVRPYLVEFQEGGRDLVILLDTSTSMGTLEGETSRLDLAKTELANLVSSQQKGTKLSLIKVGSTPEVLVNQSENRQEVLGKLKKIQPGLDEANLETALSLVTAMVRTGANVQVVLFSDGGVVLPENPVGLAEFQYHRVGVTEDNLAIGAFAMRDNEEGPLALTRIDNYSSKELEATVKVENQDKLVDVQTAKVAGGKSAYLFWPVPQSSTYLKASLEGQDGLALDNNAWLVPTKGKQAKVLLVSKGNVFLEQLLKLRTGLEVDKATPEGYKDIKENYQLYVLDSFWPDQAPKGQLLLINPPDSSGYTAAEGELTGPLQANKEHPLLTNVSWSDVHIATSHSVKVPPGWQSLLSAGNKTLLALGSQGNNRIAVLGFDLHQSDLPLRPAFPILGQNLLNWLLPAGGFRETQVIAGNPVDLALRPQAEQVILYKPDGVKEDLQLGVGRFSDTNSPGLYKLEQVVGGEHLVDYLAVNYFSPQESLIKPAAQIKLGMQEVKAQSGIKVVREYWSWLVLVALAFLSLEWWVYLRGH